MFKRFKSEEKGEVVPYLLILFAILTLLWVYYPPIKDVVLGIDSTEKVDEITKPMDDKPTTPPPTEGGEKEPPVIEKPNEELKFCGMKITDLYYATKPAGHGFKDSPYMISTLNELQWLHNLSQVNTELCYAELQNDVDAKETKTWNSGEGFLPIGEKYLKLHFDGKNHTITNLYINRPNYATVGLFGSIGDEKAAIQNVTLKNAFTQGGKLCSGILIGCFYTGVIQNVNVYGEAKGLDGIGGLLGTFYEGRIQNAHVEAKITGTKVLGGIVGFYINGQLSDSDFEGTITGTKQIGGVTGIVPKVAFINDNTIDRVHTKGTITVTEGSVGGFVGNNLNAIISDSFSHMNITCKAPCSLGQVGGFAGYLEGGIINRSYSTGKVLSPSANTGGFLGKYAAGTITNSYWDTNTSGLSSSSQGTGQTTSEMKTIPSYKNWDFSKIWSIDPSKNNGYPFLR